jgi:hypothetical protein
MQVKRWFLGLQVAQVQVSEEGARNDGPDLERYKIGHCFLLPVTVNFPAGTLERLPAVKRKSGRVWSRLHFPRASDFHYAKLKPSKKVPFVSIEFNLVHYAKLKPSKKTVFAGAPACHSLAL